MALEIYVAPAGVTIERKDITDEEAARYLGPYDSWGAASGVAKLVRSGEMGHDKAEEAARRTARKTLPPPPPPGDRNIPVQPKPASQVPPALIGSAVLALTGFILLIIGGVLLNANTGLGDLCNSGLGQLGQAFDSQAAAQCSHVNAEHTWGWVLIILALAEFFIGWLIMKSAGLWHGRSYRRYVR
jgi:hypothetical protein